MATDKRMTTIRLTDQDREVLARLCEMTGLETHSSAIRLAIREAVAIREQMKPKKKK
jgi:Arc/MetJ family transcription regulator